MPGEQRDRGADGRGAASGRNAMPGGDGSRAGFERDVLGYRDDRRGPEQDPGGLGIEPSAYRDGRGPQRDRGGLGIGPGAYGDGSGRARDRGGLRIDPSAYRDGRGPERDRGSTGFEPGAYRDGRGPERDRGGLRIEPGAYRDGRGPERDRGGLALEPGSLRSDERPMTPQLPNGTGLELGPEIYRDDGWGAVADVHALLPSRVSVDPGRSPDQSPGYQHIDRPVERPDLQQHVLGDSLSRRSEAPAEGDDDIVTAPLPVILPGTTSRPRPEPVVLPGATSRPRPEPVVAPRGPFEPAQTRQPSARPVSVTGSVPPPPATLAAPVLPLPPGPRVVPAAAAAKLDQLRELYLTAEAIGEDALGKHFEQVSQRQRELIQEFFDRSTENDDAPS